MLAALAPCLLLGGYAPLVVPAGIVALWVAMHAWTGSAWPRTDLNWCIAVLLLLAAVSLAVTRGTVAWAIPKVTTLVFGIACFWLLVRWHRAGIRAQSMTWLFVIAALALSVAGLLATRWTPKVWPLSTITSSLPRLSLGVGGVHPNPLAGTLLLLIPLCIPPLAESWRARKAAPLRLAVVSGALIFSLSILLLTQSRGGWLAALATAGSFLLYRVRVFRARPILPIAIAFAAACALVAFWASVPRNDLAGGDLVEKWAARRELWRLGVLFIGDFPWTGVGFNGYRNLATSLYTSDYDYYGMDIAHPHNMWLSAGVDLGLPGILIYLALWAVVLRRTLRATATGVAANSLIAQCLLSSWAGFWTFGIADAIPLGSKLSTFLWASFALSQMLPAEPGTKEFQRSQPALIDNAVCQDPAK